MPLHLLLFSLSVIICSVLPALPPLWCLLILLPAACLLRWRYGSYCLALLLGCGWGIYSGHKLLAMQLADEWVGQDLLVSGSIQGLPEKDERRVRFNFRVTAVSTASGTSIPIASFPQKLQLSWYQYRRDQQSIAIPEILIADQWQLRVRLKRPRGFVNPAGFDYQAWLLRQGIGATGYVVEHTQNHRMLNSDSPFLWDDWIDQQRYELQQWIVDRSHSSERGILVALLIGDSALVEKDQWLRMQQTGTSHLIAISGLHVGFLAIFGFYIGLWLGKCIQLLWHSCPSLMIAWLCAIGCAGFYSALAGFNIPTIRTLIMLALFYSACLWRRSVRVVDIFCFALAIVVVLDPLAVFDMGFWLSFGAVALLLFYFSGRRVNKPDASQWHGYSVGNVLSGFIRSQWVMFIGLIVPLSLLVSSISLVAPLANAIAIPLITFFVVPLLLVGAALKDSALWLSNFLLGSSGTALEWLSFVLQKILDITGDYASPIVAFSPALSLLIGLGCLVLLMPKGLFPGGIGWGALAIGATLSFMLEQPNRPDLKVSIMDVGQGTAVIVQVKDKVLLYDTGPKFTDSFDAGSAILAPYLYSQGVTHVDVLVVSHSDMDHAGGMSGLLEKVSAEKILLSEILKFDANKHMPPSVFNCHGEPAWTWGGVTFEFLPLVISSYTSDNNKSCVLLIRYGDQYVLLPGDIETRVENQLLDEQKIPQNLTLLLAAHHGSRTSSGVRFVNFTKPEYVVYSAGYRSQHGHPHPTIQERFQIQQSRGFNTAESGALIFEWYKNHQSPVIREYRKIQRRYWF
ncbi:DNA internalization-related competence protein ComEC/Rec2 [Cellvibrio sp. pealriver]|uniref:DNA internalization-related competence protein ComEC/Rec2 n=1 Tax=Cellvibrio sp. pealriver TaxID=1622269 RepID=UPI000AE675FD|nr:DNA internalization-related competence protein ComEC/Rec2 [Cellvibrio sp. pealriver]